MRMRLKNKLYQRIDEADKLIIARESENFYLNKQKSINLDLHNLFGNNNPVILEIGCGKGKYATTYAKNNPNVNIVAVDMISNVIIEAVEKAMVMELNNIRFMNVSADNLLYYLSNNTISKIVLNFPCPYKKNSYSNCRLTHPRFISIYDSLLVEGGSIVLTTDKDDFFEYSLNRFTESVFNVTNVIRDLPLDIEYATEYETRFRNEGVKIKRLTAMR